MVTRRIGGGGLVSLFVRHPNAANLVMVLMILFGIFAIGRINTQFLPKTEIPVISVSVAWSGASAEDVEANILEIMEPELRFLDGVDRVTSRAREGSASIGLEYVAEKDLKDALREVENAVKAITNLPEDAETPEVRQAARGFDRVARLAVTGDFSETALRFYAKKIRDDLIERGIDKVILTGLRPREIEVAVPEQELRRLDMTVQDISTAIASNSRDLPSGQMEGLTETQLRTVAELETPEAVAQLEVKSWPTGEKVLLGDVAQIRDTFDNSVSQGFVNGKRAIQIEVQRAETADTVRTANLLLAYVDEIRGQLPPGLEVTVYDVRADALIQRIMVLVKNGLGGLVLVVIILFIFLNARIAFWVAAGIPVAMLATIGLMYLSGQTINMLTLFALIMMLGIIVDDAIVVGEHTATRFSAGDGPYEAAENGAGRMVTPVIAAMLTTIAAFAPIWVVSGVLGQIVSVLPFVVIAVIIASLVECFLILPGHLAHTLQPRAYRPWSYWRQLTIALSVGVLLMSVSAEGAGGWLVQLSKGLSLMATDLIPGVSLSLSPGGFIAQVQEWRASLGLLPFVAILSVGAFLFSLVVEAVLSMIGRWRRRGLDPDEPIADGRFRRGFDAGFEWFKEKPFNWFTRLTFRYRYVTIAVAVSSVLVGAVGMLQGDKVGFVFFPSAEAENINARIVFNAGIKQEDAIAAIARIEGALREAEKSVNDSNEPLVTASFATYGAAGRSTGDNLAEIRVQLTTSESRTIRTPEIVSAWRRSIPAIAGVRRVSVYESRGGPPGRDIEIQLKGDNAAKLKEVASQIIPIVETVDAVTGVADDLPYGKPELVMEMTPRGRALGFTIEAVGRQLRNAFEGAIPRRFADGDDEITVRVTRIMRREGLSTLRDFELKAPGGDFVPLSDVVSITERQGFAAIERIDGRATVSVTADLNTDLNTTEKAIAYLEQSAMPGIIQKAGVEYRYAGRDEERREAFADLRIGIMVALSVIYIILAWVFASYTRPLAVMLIIPFGVVGAVMGHYLWGVPLTIFSMIGLLGLAGILVNDSIILVSRLDERLEEGDTLEEAAVGASRDRLRAVLLTSLTTIGGLVPLLYEKSVQAQFLIPMALTMVFGLAIATALVLFLVPAIVGVGADIRWFFASIFGSRRASGDNFQAAE